MIVPGGWLLWEGYSRKEGVLPMKWKPQNLPNSDSKNCRKRRVSQGLKRSETRAWFLNCLRTKHAFTEEALEYPENEEECRDLRTSPPILQGGGQSLELPWTPPPPTAYTAAWRKPRRIVQPKAAFLIPRGLCVACKGPTSFYMSEGSNAEGLLGCVDGQKPGCVGLQDQRPGS